MTESGYHEHPQGPDFRSSADALGSLAPLPQGELQFVDRYGKPIEHKRTFLALPSGDEIYTDKPTVVWEEDILPPYMMDQAEAVVFDEVSLFEALKRNNQEGEK